MGSWLLCIVGVVFLGVLFDLIYPKGKTNSLCKSIFGMVAVFIMISPILNIDINKVKLDNIGTSDLVENISDRKGDVIKLQIDSHLISCGIEGVIVRLETNLSEDEFLIDRIYIDTTNLVLTDKFSNINKYEVIINEVSNLLDISKERIVVYG